MEWGGSVVKKRGARLVSRDHSTVLARDKAAPCDDVDLWLNSFRAAQCEPLLSGASSSGLFGPGGGDYSNG